MSNVSNAPTMDEKTDGHRPEWVNPRAMAIPPEGYFTLERGRFGPTFPRTPACHGFTIIAKFSAGASNNVGSGYWTHALSSGQTVHMARDGRLTVSAFEMYEIHTWQRGTSIRPGDTFDLDASLMIRVASGKIAHLHAGAVGYAQRQTTARTGSGVPPESSGDRYAVHAAGVALSAAFPKQRANLAFKYFSEFANRSTFEGYALQVVGAIAL